MQKLLKNIFPYYFLLILPLLFIHCEAEKEEATKIEYKGILKYFPDQFGIERFISEHQKSGAYITLPECFHVEYNNISIKNNHNFYCSGVQVYFTIDRIEKAEMDYYAGYFNDEKLKNQNDQNILRDYIVSIRESTLKNSTKSIYSKMKTNEKKTILLGSIKGLSNAYTSELLYQFGVIADGNTYYILQCIMSVDNSAFLHQDVLEIFKSFRIN